MLRLAKYVAVILVVTYVVLYVLRERFLKGAGVFLNEYAEGIIPWLLLVVICKAVLVGRRRLRSTRPSVTSDGPAL